MSAHEILIAVMAAFAALGALDRIFGNRFGIGKEFEEGILAMGSLAMAMIGVITLAPVLAAVLKPVVVPVFSLLGADPAMFAGSILACDMGGGALAAEMTTDRDAALLGGVLTGSMLGATIVFTIPVAMAILSEEDRRPMAKGILCGIVTIPFGVLAGGLVAGFAPGMVLRNLIPIVLIGVLIAFGLWKAENIMIRGFAEYDSGLCGSRCHGAQRHIGGCAASLSRLWKTAVEVQNAQHPALLFQLRRAAERRLRKGGRLCPLSIYMFIRSTAFWTAPAGSRICRK